MPRTKGNPAHYKKKPRKIANGWAVCDLRLKGKFRVEKRCFKTHAEAESFLDQITRYPHEKNNYAIELFRNGKKRDYGRWHRMVCAPLMKQLACDSYVRPKRRALPCLADALNGEGDEYIARPVRCRHMRTTFCTPLVQTRQVYPETWVCT